jgi:hypothetical protein
MTRSMGNGMRTLHNRWTKYRTRSRSGKIGSPEVLIAEVLDAQDHMVDFDSNGVDLWKTVILWFFGDLLLSTVDCQVRTDLCYP